jgi:hypothetical protein
MARWMRRFLPIMVLLALSVLAGIDAVAAVGDGRVGRGAFKAFSGVVWLFLAYMLYESSKRKLTDSK